ncbi:MAG: pantoate--beta-alanine ligase [Hyphomicrobiales bacterium]
MVVRTVADLRRFTDAWRADGETSALVPTMGALHAGHLSLVDVARERAQRVVASIFVNPAQFSPSEDLATYPRDEAGDLAKLHEYATDLVFMPPGDEMYPANFSTSVEVGGLSEGLCGASRPHFFGGVATVVAKLLIQARCDHAVFGEKDYQQLLVVRRMARDLDIPTEIIGAPIIREEDGLAMSSRNQYLDAQQRQMAPHLYATLMSVADCIRSGTGVTDATDQGVQVLDHAGFDVDYLELRDAATLEPLTALDDSPARLFAGAYLGKTRLIDNVAV